MVRGVLFISICLFFVQCNSIKVSNNANYPDIIIDKSLEDQYNISKWYLYCIFSDVELELHKKTGLYFEKVENIDRVTFGELDLMLESVRLSKDTTELVFYFYYKNEKLGALNCSNFLYSGTVFIGNVDSITHFLTDEVATYLWFKCEDIDNCPKRQVKPLQPEVKKYIQDNKDVINPWFRAEAIKRGVITE